MKMNVCLLALPFLLSIDIDLRGSIFHNGVNNNFQSNHIEYVTGMTNIYEMFNIVGREFLQN